MTIVVGAATPEGLVLASDSRTTTVDEHDRHRIGSDSAQKVFKLGRMAAATFGAAFVQGETIAGLMDQFAAQHGEQCDGDDIEAFAQALGGFFSGRVLAESPDWDTSTQGFVLGFLVAGYDPAGVGHTRVVLVPGPELQNDATTRTGGMIWQGQTDVVTRLIHGVDGDRLAMSGVEIPEDVGEAIRGTSYILPGLLTLQDGVDFAAFVVRTTIDMQRFSDGTEAHPKEVPGCGGPVQIVVVERSGPRWVSELKLLGPSQPGSAEGALRRGGLAEGGV